MTPNGKITISIAETPVSIECENREILEKIRERYLPFASAGTGGFRLAALFDAAAPPISSPLEVARDGAASYNLKGAVKGKLSFASMEGEVVLPPDLIAFDGLLRLLFGALLLEAGGLLLHAGGVARHGLAWVFFGPSEAGKTTIMKSCPADSLSDEIVAIRKNAAGKFEAHSTPFHGKWEPGNRLPPRPLAALFHLEKSVSTSLEKIAPPQALKLLLPQVIMHPDIADAPRRAAGAALDNAAAIVVATPCYRLNFSLDTAAAEVIDKINDKRKSLSTDCADCFAAS